nr:required for excision 1-B domain-containing protein-like [Lytechinus pictus]
MKVEGPKTMIHEFYSLQEERVRVYHLLDEGHTAYLGTSPDYDFVGYRQIVHDKTEDFKRISQRIIGIEAAFRDQYQNIAIADCLKKVQEAEQDKLEKTAALQLTKQRLQDEPGNEEHKRELSDLKHRQVLLLDLIGGSDGEDNRCNGRSEI